MDILRFATAGSVDDGKSTLIGRLLNDTKSILEDQLLAVKRASEKKGESSINLALLTDGLRAEREQGITIDVAYRYFSTLKRKFILADTPGHVQYTRNMVTAVSGVNLVIILIDARNGIVEQTKRHLFIAELLGIKHLVVCINKMDMINYDQSVYDKICSEFSGYLTKTGITDVQFIPISALNGDNIVDSSKIMTWYKGSTLLYILENVKINSEYNMIDSRFLVQTVIRPSSTEFHDYRGYGGKIAGGIFKPGDEVVVLPSGFTSKIKKIHLHKKEYSHATPPLSVNILLEDNIDISRGDMIAKPQNIPNISQDLDLLVCWLDSTKLTIGKKYILKHTTKDVKCIIKEVVYKINIDTLHRIDSDKEIGLNDIGRIKIRTTSPLLFDTYKTNKITGSVILIDESTNQTIAAGIIKSSMN